MTVSQPVGSRPVGSSRRGFIIDAPLRGERAFVLGLADGMVALTRDLSDAASWPTMHAADIWADEYLARTRGRTRNWTVRELGYARRVG